LTFTTTTVFDARYFRNRAAYIHVDAAIARVWVLLAICRPSGCTVASGVVGVVVVVVGGGGGDCNRSQMRSNKMYV